MSTWVQAIVEANMTLKNLMNATNSSNSKPTVLYDLSLVLPAIFGFCAAIFLLMLPLMHFLHNDPPQPPLINGIAVYGFINTHLFVWQEWAISFAGFLCVAIISATVFIRSRYPQHQASA